jgi:hypothetical protein
MKCQEQIVSLGTAAVGLLALHEFISLVQHAKVNL